MIKVISFGKKNGRATAQIVEQSNNRSFTRHLWHIGGNSFMDRSGRNFTLSYNK